MPQKRNAKSIEAHARYRAGEKLVDIAKSLGVPDGTVRRWKSDHDWDGKKKQTERSVSKANGKANKKTNARNKDKSTNNPNEESSPTVTALTSIEDENENPKTDTIQQNWRYGNQNALGNRGGHGGPPRNKKAVKTHEFEKIFYPEDLFDDDEKELLNVNYDKFQSQYILIDTLRIRERRILRAIKELLDDKDTMVPESATVHVDESTQEHVHRNKAGEQWNGNEINNKSELTQRTVQAPQVRLIQLEEVLTRVQGRLQRAIEVLHKMELEEYKVAIDCTKLDLYRQRLAGVISIDELLEVDLMDASTITHEPPPA